MNETTFANTYSHKIETIIQPENLNILVINALRFVIENVFINITNTFAITISSNENQEELRLSDIMSKLFTTWGFVALNLVVLDKKHKRKYLPGKRYCNMIMVDSFESLEKTNIAEYNSLYDSIEYYFIFLQIADDEVSLEMDKIFRYCLDNYWLHCNVMIENNMGDVNIYTYFPFQDGKCFQTHPVKINQFIGDRFINSVMFPNKLKNFHLCPVKLNTWETPPFIICKPNCTQSKHKIVGFEMMMMDALSRNMNFTIDVELLQISTDLTASKGPLENLRDRETNISFGYFRRTAARDQIATPTFVTYYLPLVAIVLRKQDQYESLGILIFPFDKYTWYLLLLSYAVLAVINSHHIKTNILNCFQMFEILIGVPTVSVPVKASRRIRFMIWVLSTFILRSVYQSLLFYLYRTHFYKSPPASLNALSASGYTAICNELSQQFLLYVPQIIDKTLPLITLNDTNEMDPLRYLERYPKENFAAMTIEDFAFYYAATEMDIGNALEVLPINVNDQQIGFYFTKHSYLIERFNYCILRCHQAGLLERWRIWTNYGYKVSKQKGAVSNSNTELMVNLEQLLGFFLAIMLLNSISIAVFALELLSKKIIWLQDLF